MTWDSLLDKFWPSAVNAGSAFVYFLGHILFAIIVLLLGLYVSRLVSSYSQKLFEKIKFDERCSKLGVNELLSKFGFGKSPSYALAFILSWVVVLLSVFYAAQILGLKDIQSLIEKFLKFVPTILVSLFILIAGMLLGKFSSKIIANSARANDLPGGIIMARAANFLIILFAALMALDNLGMNMALINSLVLVALSSLGLAFAIALGLGAKPLVEEALRNTFNKKENDK